MKSEKSKTCSSLFSLLSSLFISFPPCPPFLRVPRVMSSPIKASKKSRQPEDRLLLLLLGWLTYSLPD